MADLSIDFAGIRSPNPFWLASAPPANSGAQVHRAFEAGWGGAVWKTIGAPVLNVSNRYGAWHYGAQKMLGDQQRRADFRSSARSESARDPRRQTRLAGSRRHRVGHGGIDTRSLARHRPPHRRHRRRRHRAELRLPARHERARHGRGGRPGPRILRADHALGYGGRAHSRSSSSSRRTSPTSCCPRAPLSPAAPMRSR